MGRAQLLLEYPSLCRSPIAVETGIDQGNELDSGTSGHTFERVFHSRTARHERRGILYVSIGMYFDNYGRRGGRWERSHRAEPIELELVYSN